MCLQINRNNSFNEVNQNKNTPVKTELKDDISDKNITVIKSDSANVNILKQGSVKIASISFETNKDLSISNQEIFKKVESLQKDANIKVGLSEKQKDDISKFNPDQKKMFVKALEEMENFKNGKNDASGYMMNLLKYAAELSGKDSKKFINLSGEVFSEVPDALDFFRKILGGGPKTSGGILEPIYEGVIKTHGGAGVSAGFNENITDDLDKNNTITHHIGEFLQVGYNRGESLGKLADDIIDGDVKIIGMKRNEGDIRSAYFASMLGHAMKENKISPEGAVKMIRWTYTNHHEGKEPPPFGTKKIHGEYVKWNQYKFDDWVKAYNKAFPNDKLS